MQEVLDRVENLVHPETQVREHGIDLTVGAIHEVAGQGRIDFGGDELEEADLEPHDLTRRNPDDEYQWWHLDAGTYVLQYNELVTGDEHARLLLQPRNKLMARGASHPTVTVGAHLPLVPLTVGGAGIEIKENARVSTVVPVEAGPSVGDDEADDAVDADIVE